MCRSILINNSRDNTAGIPREKPKLRTVPIEISNMTKPNSDCVVLLVRTGNIKNGVRAWSRDPVI
jgi:hypothetical protein